MEVIDVVSRIVHVSTAIVLVGGVVFNLLVLMPASSALSEEPRAELMRAVVGRWKKYVHSGILLFLLSGFYNYFQAMKLHKGDGLYHGLVGTKIILAFVIFFISAALVGRSPALEKIRNNRVFWTRVVILLAAIIVAISGFVKVRSTM